MLKIITTLVKKGFAYKASDNSIYFNILKFKKYGSLSKIPLNQLSKHRITSDEYDKKSISDFVLWKAYKKEDGEVFWDSSFGRGRPGWHIECSAMSLKNLSSPIDIHSGGVDLIFPHHENEIAQSEAYTGKKFVRFWVHIEHLLVNGKKMSKSLNNFYTLHDLINKNYNPLSFRLLCLQTHYQSKLNFTFESLNSAQAALKNLYEWVFNIKKQKNIKNAVFAKKLEIYRKNFIKAIENNLDTPRALALLFKLSHETNKLINENKLPEKDKILKLIDSFDLIFGLKLLEQNEKAIPFKIRRLVFEREEARKNKNYELADKLRRDIQKEGFIVEDTPFGPKVKER